jgi:hypothetical protein
MKDLRIAFKKAVNEASKLLYNKIRGNLAAIPFKNNPVKILTSMTRAGGVTRNNIKVTSDQERKDSVLRNISRGAVQDIGDGILKSHVKYTSQEFEKSHIGIYYEHGVGSNWDGVEEKIPSMRGYSSARKARGQIMSRSKYIDYQGLGKGVWVDLGGNIRVTKSTRAGEVGAGFKAYVGEETRAYHWFGLALKNNKGSIKKLFRDVIESNNIFKKKYWKVMGSFRLGRD